MRIKILSIFFCLQLVAQVPTQEQFVATARDFQRSMTTYYGTPQTPFAAKCTVKAGSKLFMWGDLHGSYDSLMRMIEHLTQQGYLQDDLRITNPNVYFLFLGDFVDRGPSGVEVLHKLMQLRVANPEQVFLVRGNHEDVDLNARYGFFAEVQKKYGRGAYELYPLIGQLYDLMPVVLYVCCPNKYGTIDALQCCHGGMELGYNPRDFLMNQDKFSFFEPITTLNRHDAFMGLPPALKASVQKTIPAYELVNGVCCGCTEPFPLGFLWSDFCLEHCQICDYTPGRGWMYGKELTRYLLQQASSSTVRLRGVVRAHQHYGVMLERLIEQRGMVSLWDGMVITLLSAPSVGGFPYDACVCLTTGDQYTAWQLNQVIA